MFQSKDATSQKLASAIREIKYETAIFAVSFYYAKIHVFADDDWAEFCYSDANQISWREKWLQTQST